MTDPAPPWRLLDSADTPTSSPGERVVPPPPTGPAADPALLRTVALLAVAGLLAVGAFVLAMSGVDGSGVAIDSSPAAVGASGVGAPDPTTPADLVVEVAGAVREPGMFRVAAGTRVGDLIALAGGYGPRVDAVRVDAELNLAATVADGERIRVPSRDDTAPAPPAAPTGPPSGSGPTGLIDLNTATLEQLDTLPGVGPVTAEKIIAAREEAPFAAVEELRSRGILGEKTFEEVRPLVAVS